MSKRPFLLLEFMIALSLLSIIVAFLFSSYRDLSLTKAILQKERHEILALQKLKLRLGQIFPHLEKLELQQPHSYQLTYDNGTDPELPFCGKLDGRLELDRQNRLVFIPKLGSQRQEILSENIKSFELKFFNQKTGKFDTTYPSEKPLMMHMILNQTITLPFFL